MRKIGVYSVFVLAVSACNNNSATTKTDDTINTAATPKNGSMDTTTPIHNSNTTSTIKGNGWSSSEKKAFIKSCTEEALATFDEVKAADYCACMEEKIEKLYPDYAEANRMTRDELIETAKDCIK